MAQEIECMLEYFLKKIDKHASTLSMHTNTPIRFSLLLITLQS